MASRIGLTDGLLRGRLLVGLNGLVARSPILRLLLALCLFGIAFYFAYRYGMSFSHAAASPFWFPDSVLLCTLLLVRPRWWWLFLLVTLPIRLWVAVPPETPLWFLVSAAAIDCAKAVLAATLLRRFASDPTRFGTVRDFCLYCLVAVLLVPALAAFVGATARNALGHDYWTTWQQWFFGDALANLIVTPALFYWILRPDTPLGTASGRRLEALLLTLGLFTSAVLAFWPTSSSLGFADARFYAPVPFLFWAALRFGMLGATGAVSILSFFAVAAALAGRGPFAGRSPAETAAGLQHFLLLRAAPLYVVAVLVEQSRRSERSLRETEGRFRTMADHAPVLIWTSGTDALCEFFNKGWLDFTGRTQEQERGAGWLTGVHPDDVQHCLETYRTSFDARQSFETDYRLRQHDGQYRWILDKGVPRYAPSGEFLGYIGCAIDVTDRRAHEAALRESEEQTDEANRKLAHAGRLASLGELTAVIAHEVNQPLAAILCNAQAAQALLGSSNPPLQAIREILADICKNDLRANETIEAIRGLTQQRAIHLKPVDLNPIIVDTLRILAGDAKRRRVRARHELAPDLPQVSADRACLEQVLLNIIVNGMDAMNDTPEARREIVVRTRHAGAEGVEISIEDNGHGIPADQIPRLFDSFFSTKVDGMGLGLSLSRSIIQAHDGRIWAENRTAGGAALHIALQAAVAEESEMPQVQYEWHGAQASQAARGLNG